MQRVLLHDSQKGSAPTTQHFCHTVCTDKPCRHLLGIVPPTTNCKTNAQHNDFRQKSGNSRRTQVRKPEFTLVNEDFRTKYNEEFSFFNENQNKKKELCNYCRPPKHLKYTMKNYYLTFSRGSNRIRTCDPLLVRQVL